MPLMESSIASAVAGRPASAPAKHGAHFVSLPLAATAFDVAVLSQVSSSNDLLLKSESTCLVWHFTMPATCLDRFLYAPSAHLRLSLFAGTNPASSPPNAAPAESQ